MRVASAALFTCALLCWTTGVVSGAEKAPVKLQHPAEAALIEDPAHGWIYRHFPTGLRLYVFDGDSAGKSKCNLGCDTAWPPLIAPADAKTTGDWTPLVRDDGRKQWAYKGRPVYTRIHDSPAKPSGDGVEGAWHLLEP